MSSSSSAAAVVLAGFLVACGSDDDSDTRTGPPAPGSSRGCAARAPTIFCDDFERPNQHAEIWKPIDSQNFVFGSNEASPTALSGGRVLRARSDHGAGQDFSTVYRRLGEFDAAPQTLGFSFRLVEGAESTKIAQFDAFDVGASREGFGI